jgi:hypothetical protein
MWAMFGIALRVWVSRNQSYEGDVPLFREEDDPHALMFSRLITANEPDNEPDNEPA